MATPESAVKAAIKKALIARGVASLSDIVAERVANYAGFFYMPVAGPFAVHGVHDFVGCWHGVFFSLETKAPREREDATALQAAFHRAVTSSGGVSFVGVRDVSVIDALERAVAIAKRQAAPEQVRGCT